ncbi:MAG: SWIM zinc finger family protein [Candidatus Thiodiazotropha sp. (ex Ustalcina ferruginea)]|nr:SWIM zinc finger family protein [Candidatus Thiodiazotropha sp. (ex Ustalcina ferruginea)]
MELSDYLTTRRIRQWAGGRSFERGQAYFEEGLVSALKERNGKITAIVSGTYSYRVVLREDDDTIDYDCDCPVGQDGDFCKHCVATALAWLEKQAKTGAASRGKKKPKKSNAVLTMKDVRAWLLLHDKDKLADMLIEAASEDDQLEDRLMLKAAATKGVNLATYRKIIDQAINSGDGYIDYYGMHDYWRGVADAVEAIRELLKQGYAAAMIELCEYALKRAERAIEYIDDHDGDMYGVMEDLQELHLAACRKAKPDPEALTERLFFWELQSDWDIISHAIERYSRVLGKSGRAHYRELAETEWAKIKPSKPGSNREWNSRRSRITGIMESRAKIDGDTEALVAIKSKDLSSSSDFLRIAETYKQARQGDKALEWAEKGLKAFGKNSGSQLQDFLGDMYHRRKRHDEAMALIWPQFEKNLTLQSYQHLKKHAGRAKIWPTWRKKALVFIRAEIHEKVGKAKRGLWHYSPWADHSLCTPSMGMN